MGLTKGLTKESYQILSRWARSEFYIYMRPVTSKFLDPNEKHRLYWVISVEYRTTPPGHWRAEGHNINEVIAELDEQVPRSRGRRIDQRIHPGLNAPESMLNEAVERHSEYVGRSRAKRNPKKMKGKRKAGKRHAKK